MVPDDIGLEHKICLSHCMLILTTGLREPADQLVVRLRKANYFHTLLMNSGLIEKKYSSGVMIENVTHPHADFDSCIRLNFNTDKE